MKPRLKTRDDRRLKTLLDQAASRYTDLMIRTMKSELHITPIPHPINAVVRVPGSKSLTNRALLIASLAKGTTRLTNALFSDDSLYFAKALQTLGFDVQMDENKP